MPESFPFLIVAAFVLLEATAAVYDLWTLTIPNPLAYGIAALFFITGALDPGSVAWLSHIGAGLIVLVVTVVLFHYQIFGGGDVKLYAATALWFGLSELPMLLLAVGIAGLVTAFVLLPLRRALPPLLTLLPERIHVRLLRSFREGEGVPYGVAIAISAIGLALV